MKKLVALPLLALFIGFTSCSDDENGEVMPPVEMGQISSFTGVELKLSGSDSEEFGSSFSVSTGKTYKESEISDQNVAEIDFVSAANRAFIAFDSPDEDSVLKEITGAKKTLIQISNVDMTVEDFDAMENDTPLKDLTIVSDNDSQSVTYRGVVLFETADGKKGAMKINALNAERISFDVKVMK